VNEDTGYKIATVAIIWAASIAVGMLIVGIITLLTNFGPVMIPHILMGLGLLTLIAISLTAMMRMLR